MTTTTVFDRPDPRRPESWCREGVAHDHQELTENGCPACGPDARIAS